VSGPGESARATLVNGYVMLVGDGVLVVDAAMNSPLFDLGLSLPLVAAPLGGGPGTSELVLAAARAGAIGVPRGRL
jgi:hypothetical protein